MLTFDNVLGEVVDVSAELAVLDSVSLDDLVAEILAN